MIHYGRSDEQRGMIYCLCTQTGKLQAASIDVRKNTDLRGERERETRIASFCTFSRTKRASLLIQTGKKIELSRECERQATTFGGRISSRGYECLEKKLYKFIRQLNCRARLFFVIDVLAHDVSR